MSSPLPFFLSLAVYVRFLDIRFASLRSLCLSFRHFLLACSVFNCVIVIFALCARPGKYNEAFDDFSFFSFDFVAVKWMMKFK